MAVCEQLTRKGSTEAHSRGGEAGGRKEKPSLHHLCFNLPLTQLEKDLSDLSGALQEGETVRCVRVCLIILALDRSFIQYLKLLRYRKIAYLDPFSCSYFCTSKQFSVMVIQSLN